MTMRSTEGRHPASEGLHLRASGAVLADLLSPEILHDLQANIEATPDITIRARRNLIEQALAAGGIVGAMESDITLPGWSQDLIDELSEIYAEDLAEVAAISGVEFISA